ncbi:division/cell wall cluster transcriptional repressor MraZ [Granulicatella seriolae]|uniref:Transcriptional regulator MraZ n=1 Tax=Granulicatella seriolae TaxID=2967226 RepID=A0ABT1WNJ6_9LACT|nr:division/cell wall cluster transcriptional repressor MraZ [Granulicatella seriolae]
MLIGEYQHTVDAKGRMIVPAKFRDDLGLSFIITRGFDGCLFGYPAEQWAQIQEKLKQLPLSKKESRSFTRFFYSAATEVEIDKQGRVNIPQTLRDFAKLEKNCRVVGISDRIEIWSEARWLEFAESAEENFEELAENMIDFGF